MKMKVNLKRTTGLETRVEFHPKLHSNHDVINILFIVERCVDISVLADVNLTDK